MDKKTIVLIGSVLIAVIFISSIAAFGNGEGNTTSLTTTIVRNTTFVAGSANAFVYGYSPTLVIGIGTQYPNASTTVSNILDSLLATNKINDFFPQGNGFVVYLGNTSAYNLSTSLTAAVGNVPLGFNATIRASLPENIALYNSGSVFEVHLGNSTYPIQTSRIAPIGSNIPVNIQAIVYLNVTLKQGLAGYMYSVYDGNLKLSPR
jgi:hypothetical protein